MSQVGTFVALLASLIAVAVAQNGADTQPSALTTQARASRPHSVHVAMGVILGMVEQRTLPAYPDQAMTKGIQGDAIFKINIDETGKIVLGAPVDGDPLLIAPSVDALRGFRFRPYLLNGIPVSVESLLGFHFSVEKTGDGVRGHVECMVPTSMPASMSNRTELQTEVANDTGVLVVDPRKLSGPEPQLPPELAGKSGSVYLTITIGADGKVQGVKVVGGDEPFIGPVIAAVKQNVYEPQLLDGKPAAVTTEASYRFGSPR
jgi:outer membrane biosynthesis protein TonB